MSLRKMGMIKSKREDRSALRGIMRTNEPMSRHVTWRAGGHARCAYFPADLDDLACFLAQMRPDEPLLTVGCGSNLLVRDHGFDGSAIFTREALSVLRFDAGLIYAEAGVACAKLARFAARCELVGAEFLVGIPGTIGGALAMNAGCFGSETWDWVEQVLMLNRAGEKTIRRPEEFVIGYRRAGLKAVCDELFAGVWLRFQPGSSTGARNAMSEYLRTRKATQPLHLPNAGSVFRNPPQDYAGRLIEACGLKGYAQSHAQVSEKHANFIVNPGGKASASAIETLIRHIEVQVREKFGVVLRPEVRIVGTQL